MLALREAAIVAFGKCGAVGQHEINPTALIDVCRNEAEALALRETAIESLDSLGNNAASATKTLVAVLKASKNARPFGC